MSTIVYPAVEVTLASGFANVPPTVFVSYVETVTVRGNPVIRDEHGYSLRVSPDAIRSLGYDATFSIENERLVATPVPCEGCGFPPADCECSWHAAYAKAQRLARAGNHGNVARENHVDRCFCGCKYWRNDRCIDCGDSGEQAVDRS